MSLAFQVQYPLNRISAGSLEMAQNPQLDIPAVNRATAVLFDQFDESFIFPADGDFVVVRSLNFGAVMIPDLSECDGGVTVDGAIKHDVS